MTGARALRAQRIPNPAHGNQRYECMNPRLPLERRQLGQIQPLDRFDGVLPVGCELFEVLVN